MHARGDPRDSWWGQATGGDAGGRWLAAALVVSVHVALYFLLQVHGGAVSIPVADRDDQRIRLAWLPRQQAQPQPLAPVVSAHLPHPARTGVMATVNPATTAPSLAQRETELAMETDEDDSWELPATVANLADADFRRDLFAHPEPDPFAPARHLPGVSLHDSSFGGRLQAEARRRACGTLRAGLSRRSESTAAIMSSMRRWKCTL